MENPNDLKSRIDALRQRSASATGSELEAILAEARQLVRASFETEFETEARNLWRQISEQSTKGDASSPVSGKTAINPLAQRIEQARMQVNSSSMNEVESGIGELARILAESGDQGDEALIQRTLESLKMAAGKSQDIKARVINVLQTVPSSSQTTTLINSLRQQQEPVVGESLPRFPAESSGLSGGSTDVEEIMQRGRRSYYAGEYMEAIDRFQEALRLSPNHKEALERIHASEEKIRSGFVPDTKVPFEARAAFGRAQSLERAGRYEDARDKYNDALEIARTQGIPNWPPVVEALLQIDKLIITQETRLEADRFLREDRWPEAIDKYEAVLRLNSEDPRAKENLENLKKVQEGIQNARVQLNSMSGNLSDLATTVIELLQRIRDLRAKMPESKKLSDFETEIMTKARGLKNRMIDGAKARIDQIAMVSAVSERIRLLKESVRLLDGVIELGTEDNEALDLAQNAGADLAKLEQADADLKQVKILIDRNTDEARKQAKEYLRVHREYNQDPRYRQYLSTLYRQYLDQVENALADGHPRTARSWATAVREEPFRLLGRSEELSELDRRIVEKERAPLLKYIGLSALVIIALLVIGGLSRSIWYPLIFPPTPEPTRAATVTVVPTNTPVPPTVTFTPTLTATVTITPTRIPPVCALKNPDSTSNNVIYVYKDASYTMYSFTAYSGDLCELISQQRDYNGVLWFSIRVKKGDTVQPGWVPARFVNSNATPVP